MSQIQNLRPRKPTVLIHLGRVSLSRNAFLLGFALILLQIADGLLTHAGLSLFGVQMEGNALLRSAMYSFGSVSLVLLIAKLIAISMIVWLTFEAHTRRWIRPLLGMLSGFFIVLAVVPWSIILLRS